MTSPLDEGQREQRHGSAAGSPPVAVVVVLSGERRGTTLRLGGERIEIGAGAAAGISLPGAGAAVADRHARLERRGASYEIVAAPDRPVWVNGEAVERLTLASGDVLEIGRGGPTLRFRLYPPGSPAHKSLAEAYADCLDCARDAASTPAGRAAVLVTGLPRELLTQTAPWFRTVVVLALLVLLSSTVVLTLRGRRLERRLAIEADRLGGIASLLEESERELPGVEELEELRAELAAQLSAASRRLEALEARSGATARVIAAASRSVIFLQGAYGFEDPATRRPLRYTRLGPDGRPLRRQGGEPFVGLDGSGPAVEILYTGTAFVAGPGGLMMTNRHVAVPWAHDESARRLVAQGMVPVMRRFVGYLPGVAGAFDVDLVAASDAADVALLRCSGVTGRIPALEFAARAPAPGDEVLVLGYPTGMRALLARAEPTLVDRVLTAGGADFWTIAERLADAGHIRPLASRGIVGQVTSAAIVYDAETTQGGSGGPVIDLDGRVVAVNAAILPEFGGSNLGVPAARGRALIAAAGGG